MAAKWRNSKYIPPVQPAGRLGISPAKVSEWCSTHAHWDHTGNLAPYPNARVWIQEAELANARDIDGVDGRGTMTKGMRRKDVEALQDRRKGGRCTPSAGRRQVAPGISPEP